MPHLFPALFRCVSIFEAKIFTVEFTRGLKDVQEIQSNDRAFAVIMSNGTVASWGIGDAGGDSSEVQDLLKDVRHIQVGCVFFLVVWLLGVLVVVAISEVDLWWFQIFFSSFLRPKLGEMKPF